MNRWTVGWGGGGEENCEKHAEGTPHGIPILGQGPSVRVMAAASHWHIAHLKINFSRSWVFAGTMF